MRYWLAFDVGIRGDFEKLYEWLANHDAVECCTFVASFVSNSPRNRIEAELKGIVRGAKIRLYLIGTKPKVLGRFIAGTRKEAPWAGYSFKNVLVEDLES